jgi:hypothetical protein
MFIYSLFLQYLIQSYARGGGRINSVQKCGVSRPIWTFGLWSSYFAELQSPTGPQKRFKEVTAAHVGGHC